MNNLNAFIGWFLVGFMIGLIQIWIKKLINNHKKVSLKDLKVVFFPSHTSVPILNGIELVHEKSKTTATSPDVSNFPVAIHYYAASETMKKALIAKGYKPDW